MKKENRTILIVIFIGSLLGSLWDMFTTFTGANSVTQNMLFSVILTLFINGVLYLSMPIIRNYENVISWLSIPCLIAAFICDLVTSFNGNRNFINLQTESEFQLFIIGCSAFFNTAASVFVSYMVFEIKIFRIISEIDHDQEDTKS